MADAQALILRYVEEMAVQLGLLTSPELAEALNEPAHGLTEDELVDLMFPLFQQGVLVAHRLDRRCFTPTGT